MTFTLKQNRKLLTLLLAGMVAVFSACSNMGAGISNVEIGENNSAEAHIGAPVTVSANIALDENIESVVMKIVSTEGESWEFTQNYSHLYAGNKTAKFQETIEVPADAEVGNYELILTATSENDVVEETTTPFRVSIDSTVPSITDLEVGLNNAGNDLHLEAHIDAAKKIKQITLTVKGAGWIKDTKFDQDHIKGQTHVHFHEHADVDAAPAGNYQAILLVEDEEGRKAVATTGFVKN